MFILFFAHVGLPEVLDGLFYCSVIPCEAARPYTQPPKNTINVVLSRIGGLSNFHVPFFINLKPSTYASQQIHSGN